MKHLLLLCAAVFAVIPVHAMTPPSVSANVVPRSPISGFNTPTGSGWGVGLTAWQSSRDDLRSGTKSVPNPDNQKSENFQTTLSLDINLAPRWAALITLPYISNEISFSGTTQKAEGLGDAALYLKYTLFQSWVNSTREVQLIGGVDSETGETRETDAQGNLLPASEQPGSNSTDIIIGGALNWGFLGFVTHADLTYRMMGTAGYQFGDAVFANAGINVPLRAKSWSLTGEVNAEFRERDRSSLPGPAILPNKEVRDSGGETIYLTPGVQWHPSDRWFLNAAVQVPVYQYFHGTQLAADANYIFSVYRRFGPSL